MPVFVTAEKSRYIGVSPVKSSGHSGFEVRQQRQFELCAPSILEECDVCGRLPLLHHLGRKIIQIAAHIRLFDGAHWR